MRTMSAVLGLALAACDSGDEGVVRREGEPDFVVKFDKTRMDAAIAEAKATLDEFVKALEARTPGTSDFTLKKGFPTSRGALEFIWISGIRKKGDGFEGEIGNEPVDVASLKVDQTVTLTRAEVVDWMYRRGVETQGGYTIAALVYGTPQQKEYEQSLGIKDWSRYRFLKKR